MPQKSEFVIPFPRRISTDLANPRTAALAHERHLAWAKGHGLLASEEAERRYVRSGVADCLGHLLPNAVGDDLALLMDHAAWFFPYDDQWDVPADQNPDHVATTTETLIALLGHSFDEWPTMDTPPRLVGAFADLWQRSATGMSARWRQGLARDWIDYLTGCLTEATDRQARTELDSHSLLLRRRSTVAVRIILDLAERTGHFEVPPPVCYSTHLATMRLTTIDHVILVNEVCSLELEAAHGDPNLVLCLAREQGCGQQDAIAHIQARANTLAHHLQQLTAQLPHLCDRLELPEADRHATLQYAHAMGTIIRGNYDWSRDNGRYSTDLARTITPDTAGYLNCDDLSLPL